MVTIPGPLEELTGDYDVTVMVNFGGRNIPIRAILGPGDTFGELEDSVKNEIDMFRSKYQFENIPVTWEYAIVRQIS